MRHSMKPDLRADYKIRLYTGPKTPFFEVSIFIDQPIDPNLCADLHCLTRAFDLQILDQRDHVAVFQHIAIGVAIDFVCALCGGPFMRAFRTDQQRPVFIDIVGRTFGTEGVSAIRNLGRAEYRSGSPVRWSAG